MRRDKYVVADFAFSEGKIVSVSALPRDVIKSINETRIDWRQLDGRLLRVIAAEALIVTSAEDRNFKSAEFRFVVEEMSKLGFRWIPTTDVKMGSSGKRPFLYFMKKGRFTKLMKRLGLGDVFTKMLAEKPEKVAARIKKVLGFHTAISGVKVKFIHELPSAPGCAFMHSETMDALELEPLEKLTYVLKASIVPNDHVPFGELWIPTEESKWNLSAEELSTRLFTDHTNAPSEKASTGKVDALGNINRYPKMSFDFQALIGHTPSIDLSRERKFLEGKMNFFVLWKYFGFYDEATKSSVLNKHGREIFLGRMSHTDPLVVSTILRGIKRRMKESMDARFMIAGPIAFAPKDAKTEWVAIMRPPHHFAVLTTVKTTKYAVWVDSDLWIKVFGGDFDGDGAILVNPNRVGAWLPKWPKDKDFLVGTVKFPDKINLKFNGTVVDAFAAQLDSQANLGRMYHRVKIVEEAMRMAGMHVMSIFPILLKMATEIVQPFIDGLKYNSTGTVMEAAEIAWKVGVWKEVKPHLDHVTTFYRVFRSGNDLKKLIQLAEEADPKSLAFHERAITVFRQLSGLKLD